MSTSESAETTEIAKLFEATILVVHLEEDEVAEFKTNRRFCSKPEAESSLIRRYCTKKNHFPYDEPFVSVAVYRKGENICDSPATIYGDSGELKKNCYVVLSIEKVIARLGVVARTDFLQLAVDIANRIKKKAPYDSKLGQLRDMRRLNLRRRLEALLWSTRDRGEHKYSEARLKGCLEEKDVADWAEC
jgi:hypothetical protein